MSQLALLEFSRGQYWKYFFNPDKSKSQAKNFGMHVTTGEPLQLINNQSGLWDNEPSTKMRTAWGKEEMSSETGLKASEVVLNGFSCSLKYLGHESKKNSHGLIHHWNPQHPSGFGFGFG